MSDLMGFHHMLLSLQRCIAPHATIDQTREFVGDASTAAKQDESIFTSHTPAIDLNKKVAAIRGP